MKNTLEQVIDRLRNRSVRGLLFSIAEGLHDQAQQLLTHSPQFGATGCAQFMRVCCEGGAWESLHSLHKDLRNSLGEPAPFTVEDVVESFIEQLLVPQQTLDDVAYERFIASLIGKLARISHQAFPGDAFGS